jgi:SPP1 gp7 family putative phage head morphogenesis protein
MLREEFETRFSGKNRDSNVAILESGMQYERASLDQKEMDYIESLKFTRDDILTAFKVPKAIISVTDNVKYAEKEAAISIFLSETINPLFKRIVEKLNEELVYTDFDPRLFITYEDPTPENKESIHKLYEIGIKNGYYLVNEIRQWEGLQPIMGGYTRYLPQNMVAVGGLPQQEKTMGEEFAKLKAAKDAQINVRNLHGKVIAKEIFVALNEINKEIHKNVMQKLKTSEVFEKIAIQKPKIGAYSELSKLTDENERDSYYKAVNDILDKKSNEYGAKVKTYFDDLGTKTVRNIIANGSKAFTKAISADDLFNKNKEIKAFAESEDTLQAIAPQESFVVTDDLQKKIDERVAMLSESVISTTIDRIMVVVETGTKAGLGINAIADNIQALFVDMSLTRADLIARTETTFANNLGLLTSYKKSGVVTHKEWIATVDNRTRPAHIAMNGEVKKIDEAFSNGLSAPGEPNCRCVMAPAFKE